jgi:hypothetical protein
MSAVRRIGTMQEDEAVRNALERVREMFNRLRDETRAVENFTGTPAERKMALQAYETALAAANLAMYVGKLLHDKIDRAEKESLS